MDNQISEADKSERLHRLQAVIARKQTEFNAGMVGHTVDVLLEKPARLSGQLVGRSPYLQAVHVMGPASLIGKVVPVTITELGTNSLHGAIAGPVGAQDFVETACAEAGA
jgi:tRNA-2-methylthio-N6-dimethylallyladenosine synthase